MIKHLIIADIPEAADIIYYQLQDGFYVKTLSGIGILPFLTEYCNIPENYISDKIKTIFHNGNPVDDIKTVKLYKGSVVAVSGAMPGIVGAMMRIGSPYAPMRESITEKGNEKGSEGEEIYVKLKLFNSILKDHGERFTVEGVIFDKDIIHSIISKCETAGKKFMLTLDNEIITSSETEKLDDEKYLISYTC
ncbi:MAG TPA: hypothetical protein PK293_13015 [Spirochaetota bacterium]|nr:hypothetical protein [Spirochaetota bacterium]HPF06951.1 hypothetical protein [Spirochaetota bacterium]HPJ43854.1 hypothetical protein [Spirochaetota bacterium]HPR38353.1 hypothetical protein [Spirochaetota bacterium]